MNDKPNLAGMTDCELYAACHDRLLKMLDRIKEAEESLCVVAKIGNDEWIRPTLRFSMWPVLQAVSGVVSLMEVQSEPNDLDCIFAELRRRFSEEEVG